MTAPLHFARCGHPVPPHRGPVLPTCGMCPVPAKPVRPYRAPKANRGDAQAIHTERRHQTLMAIVALTNALGRSPSLDEIGRAIGISESLAWFYVHELEDVGAVRRDPRGGRRQWWTAVESEFTS